MKTSFLTATAFLLLSASYAPAAITGQDIVAQYQSSGYQSIEVTVGPTQAKVEAVKDGIKTETVYDLATGGVLKTESETLGVGEDISSKVEMKTTDKDFTGDDREDDSASDDSDDDNDNSGSGSDDDGGDDDGGDDSDHSGSGHDGGDHDGGGEGSDHD